MRGKNTKFMGTLSMSIFRHGRITLRPYNIRQNHPLFNPKKYLSKNFSIFRFSGFSISYFLLFLRATCRRLNYHSSFEDQKDNL